MRPDPYAIGHPFGRRVVLEQLAPAHGQHRYRVRCEPCQTEQIVSHSGLARSSMCRACAKAHNRKREQRRNAAAFVERRPVAIDPQKVMSEAIDAALHESIRERMAR